MLANCIFWESTVVKYVKSLALGEANLETHDCLMLFCVEFKTVKNTFITPCLEAFNKRSTWVTYMHE